MPDETDSAPAVVSSASEDRLIQFGIKFACLESKTQRWKEYEFDQRVSYHFGKPWGLVALVQSTQQSLQADREIMRNEMKRLWETNRNLQSQINQVARAGALPQRSPTLSKEGKGGIEL